MARVQHAGQSAVVSSQWPPPIGIQSDTAKLENRLLISYKVKYKLTIPIIQLASCVSRKMKLIILKTFALECS